MPDSNVEMVRAGYEAFNRGDVEAALEHLHPEVVWCTYLVPGPGGGTYVGHDGVRELWRDVRRIFDDYRNDPEEVRTVGDDRVLSFVAMRGIGRKSGAPVEARLAHVMTVRDGKVARIDTYEDRDEAARAVGLRG